MDGRSLLSRVRGNASRRAPHGLKARSRRVWPPVGTVRFGSLHRLQPIDRWFGWSRGTPIDRYYIEKFLERQAGQEDYLIGDIQGRVMEVGDDKYTRRFGNVHEGPGEPPAGAVTSLDVLQGDDSNPIATLVGDLATGEGIPSDAFDCVICTQTLLLIYDVKGAIEALHRSLQPGGVALVTVPGISRVCRPDADIFGDYWRFTTHSARRLFEEVFPAENVSVETFGNAHVSAAFLYGLCVEDVRREALELNDPDFELVVAIRAVKPA
jgi:SAM-dependent methyltransferase